MQRCFCFIASTHMYLGEQRGNKDLIHVCHRVYIVHMYMYNNLIYIIIFLFILVRLIVYTITPIYFFIVFFQHPSFFEPSLSAASSTASFFSQLSFQPFHLDLLIFFFSNCDFSFLPMKKIFCLSRICLVY